MKRVWVAIWSLAATLLASAAAPVHGQRAADLPADRGWETASPAAVPDVLAGIFSFSPLPARSDTAASIQHVSSPPGAYEMSRRSSVVGYTVGGAVAGAVLGVVALYAADWDDCTEVGSMCGIAIPVYAGAGAVVGGLIGYVIGRAAN